MTMEKTVAQLSQATARWVVTALVSKVVVTQLMAGRPVTMAVSLELAMDWLDLDASASSSILEAFEDELASMMSAADTLGKS